MMLVTACFRREIRWIRRRPDIRVLLTAMGESASGALARRVRQLEGVRMLVSTGFCGGLAPGLVTGDLFLAETIRFRGEEIRISPALLERAQQILENDAHSVTTGVCECSEQIGGVPWKHRAGARGADVVDMESGPLAHWAAKHAVPFLSCRAVLDPVDYPMPFSPGRSMLWSAMRRPRTVADLAGRSAIAGRAIGWAVGALADQQEALG